MPHLPPYMGIHPTYLPARTVNSYQFRLMESLNLPRNIYAGSIRRNMLYQLFRCATSPSTDLDNVPIWPFISSSERSYKMNQLSSMAMVNNREISHTSRISWLPILLPCIMGVQALPIIWGEECMRRLMRCWLRWNGLS